MHSSIRTMCLLGCTALCLASPRTATSTTYHVDGSLMTSGDGLLWSTAFNDLPTALSTVGDGDTILIAQGTYTPHASNRNVSFLIDDSIGALTIQGGYRGGGDDMTAGDRDITGFPTILSGDLSGNDGSGIISDNSRHVVIIEPTPGDVTLDGLTVTGGYADGGFGSPHIPSLPSAGAGINAVLFDDQLTLINVTVVNNVAEGMDAFGAGVSVQGANCNFQNCIFQGNESADEGGAVRVATGNVVFSDCYFSDNQITGSSGVGGALALASCPEAQLTDCEFEFNSSDGGAGALRTSGVTTLTITGGAFRQNAAEGQSTERDGGALLIRSPNGSSTEIEGVLFEDNTATGSGGAVHIGSTSGIDGVCDIDSCTFIDNACDTIQGAGGAVAISNFGCNIIDSTFSGNEAGLAGGACALFIKELATISGSIFDDNTAHQDGSGNGGGAVHVTATDLDVSGSTFRSNEAAAGGALWAHLLDTFLIDKCLFYNNLAREGEGGGVRTFVGVETQLFNCVFSENRAESSTGAGHGGGAYFVGVNQDEPLTVLNCTFEGNLAQDDAGGMWTDAFNASMGEGGGLTIVNSIFFNNVRDADGSPVQDEIAQILVAAGEPAAPGIAISFTCIEDLGGLYTLEGDNIPDDPDFASPITPGERRVKRQSPVLDAGDSPEADSFNLAQDILGLPRIVDDETQTATGIALVAGCPDPQEPLCEVVVDMGAYERERCPGELNDDCVVNILDLNLVLGNFGTTVGPWGPGDGNGDGVVNITDLNLVLGNFGENCNCAGAQQQAQSGGGGSGGESSATSSSSMVIDPEIPAYLLWLGWNSKEAYAEWLENLNETDRLIHGVELIEAYGTVGE